LMPALARRAPRRQAFYGAARGAPQREYHGAARLASLPPAPCPAAGGYRGPASIPLSGASFAGSQREGRDGGVEPRRGMLWPKSSCALMPVDRLSHGGVMAFAQVRSRCDPGAIPAHLRLGPQPRPATSGRIKGDFDPIQACPGEAHRRRLPVTLAGVSGYHWT